MTEPNRQSGENEERSIEIETERLRPFKEHPFQVKDDKETLMYRKLVQVQILQIQIRLIISLAL